VRAATVIACVLLVFLVEGEGAAHADDAAEALAHFKAGKQAFRSGELAEKLGQRDEAIAKYRQAVDELKKAYELQPQPVMLWGLGEAYRALGEVEPALEAYRHYLADAAHGQRPNFRAQAQAHIERLERARTAATVAAAPPRSVTPTEAQMPSPTPQTTPAMTTTAPAAAPHDRARARPAAIASISCLVVGIVAVAAGGALVGHAFAINPDEPGITLVERAHRIDSRTQENTAGIAVLAVGGAALVGSAAAFGVWLQRRREPRSPVALISPVAGGALLTVGGTF